MLELYKLIDQIVDKYELELPELYKRRDPDEPHRAEKEMWEDKFFKALMRRFRWQKRVIKDRLENFPPNKQKTGGEDWINNLDLDDPETRKRLLMIFMGVMDSALGHIAVTTELMVDWTLVNQQAADWVNEHYYNHLDSDPDLAGWLTKIDETTASSLGQAIERYITEPGWTIGDVMKDITSSAMTESRAYRIARTEVTRTYAQAEIEAGRAVQAEYPEAYIVKRWFTKRDEFVCPVCGPLHNSVVKLEEEFIPGVFKPPAHVGCRCWFQQETKWPEKEQ